MTRIEEHKTLDTEALEKYIAGLETAEQNKRRDQIGLIVLVVISLLGLAFILVNVLQPNKKDLVPITSEKKIKETERSTNALNATTNVFEVPENVSDSSDAEIEELSEQPEITIPDYEHEVSIMGSKKPFQRLDISIEPFSNSLRYIIRFGDGREKTMRSASMRYSYDYEGVYSITIDVYKGNELIKSVKKGVSIRD